MAPSRLQRVVARLLEQHGRPAPPPADTAFALVLWEKVAYLARDERRAEAFELLRARVGLPVGWIVPNASHRALTLEDERRRLPTVERLDELVDKPEHAVPREGPGGTLRVLEVGDLTSRNTRNRAALTAAVHCPARSLPSAQGVSTTANTRRRSLLIYYLRIVSGATADVKAERVPHDR